MLFKSVQNPGSWTDSVKKCAVLVHGQTVNKNGQSPGS